MLNVKNIHTKRPTKKLSPRMHGPFKVLEVKKGEQAFKLEILPWWKIHTIFHVSLLEPYPASAQEEKEQPPRVPEDIKEDLAWDVEKIVKSEVMTSTRKVGRHNEEFKELCSFIKWNGCAEDKNTWKPAEGLGNAQELVEGFHRQNPEMPGLAVVEGREKAFLMWPSKRMPFFTLLLGVRKGIAKLGIQRRKPRRRELVFGIPRMPTHKTHAQTPAYQLVKTTRYISV